MDYSLNILTSREHEILILIANEYSSSEISQQLSISVGTVEAHRRKIFLKLNVRNMAGAVHKAYQMGILKV